MCLMRRNVPLCLLLCERGYRVPYAGGMERPPDGSGKEHPEVEMPTNVLNLHLSDLVLKAESTHSSGSLADIHNGGKTIQTPPSLDLKKSISSPTCKFMFCADGVDLVLSVHPSGALAEPSAMA